MRIPEGEQRTPEQLKEHYTIEKELAGRLRSASREERKHLYTALYDELFRRVPHHPQLTQKADPQAQAEAVSAQLALLNRFLKPDSTFLEVGPGDCRLAFEVAERVRKVVAVDVSEEITRALERPDNFELIISDGSSIPVPAQSVDVAYSNQLMEHLHPDDALEQVGNICRALKPGGAYICITPNRLSGPHDVSQHFDQIATGFHLREYTASELAGIFKTAEFSKVQALLRIRGLTFRCPLFLLKGLESVLARLPHDRRRRVARRFPIRAFLRPVLIAVK
jgi:SAM-dependent methyltransferase